MLGDCVLKIPLSCVGLDETASAESSNRSLLSKSEHMSFNSIEALYFFSDLDNLLIYVDQFPHVIMQDKLNLGTEFQRKNRQKLGNLNKNCEKDTFLLILIPIYNSSIENISISHKRHIYVFTAF